MNEILFEFKKFLKDKKTFFFFLITLFLLIFWFMFNNAMDVMRDKESIKLEEAFLLDNKNFLSILPNEVSQGKLSEEKMEMMSKEIEEDIDLLEKKIVALKNNDWKESLKTQIELDKRLLKGIKEGSIIGPTVEDLEPNILLNEYLLSKSIQPVDSLYPTEGFNFLNNVLKYVLSPLGIIFLILFIGDNLSKEFEHKSISLLLTQPNSRKNLIKSKWVVCYVMGICLVLFIMMVSFLLGTFINGMGTLQYPIEFGVNSSLTILENISKSIILFTFIYLFITILSLLLNTISENSIFTFVILILSVTILPYVITNYPFINSFAHLLPFTYLDTFNIVNGSLMQSLENNNITVKNGVFILFIYTIITYFITLFVIKRKEIY